MKIIKQFNSTGEISTQIIRNECGQLIDIRAFKGNGSEFILTELEPSTGLKIGETYKLNNNGDYMPLQNEEGHGVWPAEIVILGGLDNSNIIISGMELTWEVSFSFIRDNYKTAKL